MLALVALLISGQFFSQACKQGGDCTVRNLTVTGVLTADAGTSGGAATLINVSTENLAPVFAVDGTPVELLSVTPATLTASRSVLLVVNGTAYSTGTNTLFEFYVDVNGTPTLNKRIMYNPSSQHITFSGAWIVTIPSGAVTVKLYGVRAAGGGTITFNADDFVSLAYQG